MWLMLKSLMIFIARNELACFLLELELPELEDDPEEDELLSFL